MIKVSMLEKSQQQKRYNPGPLRAMWWICAKRLFVIMSVRYYKPVPCIKEFIWVVRQFIANTEAELALNIGADALSHGLTLAPLGRVTAGNLQAVCAALDVSRSPKIGVLDDVL